MSLKKNIGRKLIESTENSIEEQVNQLRKFMTREPEPEIKDCSGCGFPFMSEDDSDEYCNRYASLLDQGNPY